MHDGFCAAHETGTLQWDGSCIRLPVMGWVRMREAVRFLRDTQARDGVGRQDLNVRGMARNRCLARSIMAGAFTSFRRRLDSKAGLYGATGVVADGWFPLSKTCACCGSLKAEWRDRNASSVAEALRCQLVERHALARCASAGVKTGLGGRNRAAKLGFAQLS